MKKGIKKIAVVLTMALALGAATVVGTTATDVQAASKVKRIKFKKSSYNLQKGKKLKLSNQIVYTPKKVNTKKVTYKTSSKRVATVSSSGYVTAKAAGTVTITATSKSNKKKKATTKIVVREAISSVSFNGAASTTMAQGDTKYVPVKAYSWKVSVTSTAYKSSNSNVVSVDSKGKMTAKNPGVAKITVTKKGLYNSKSATYTVTVNKITKAGTYSNLSGALTIAAPAGATVTLNKCKLTTLTLNNQAYTVVATDSTITNVATSSAKTVAVDETHPVLQLGAKAVVNTINNKNPMSIVITSSSADLRKIKAEAQLVVAQIVSTDMPFALEIATTESVKVAADVAKLNVTDAGANVTISGNAWKVDVDTPTADTAKKPTINVSSTGSVGQVKIQDGTTNTTITGSGEVSKVVVPDTAVTGGQLTSGIQVPATADVTTASDADNDKTTIPATKSYVKATGVTSEGMTTFTVGANSDIYRITKGNHKSSVKKTYVDKIINYFANPKVAYEDWTNEGTALPVDESGIVTINTLDANTKSIVVSGTTTRDGVYTVTMNKKSDTEYTVTAVDTKKNHTYNATIVANGDTATLTGKTYTVEAKKDTYVTVKKSGETILKVTKDADNYTIAVKADKATDVSVEYLADK
ncbi:MAG: Ig-like domain-containing protein [Anaerostipes sp.]|nr:Ig-like domain-containing protein [Anaerostipes sp.]